VNIDNTGDVAAFPVWTIRGPVEELVISNGRETFGLSVAVALGETITIDTETGIVTDDTGANRYADLNPAPKLFSIPPGESSISVNGIGADINTIITCRYSLRFEVVH
jgi:phage-related protein